LRKTSHPEASRKTTLRNFWYCETYASRQPSSCKQAKNTGRVFSESFILLCLGPGEGCLLSKQERRRPVADKVGVRLLMALRAQAHRRSSQRELVLQDFSSRYPEFPSRLQPLDGQVGVGLFGLDANRYVWKVLDFRRFLDAAVRISASIGCPE